ncbi:thiamine pyrophosphate-dependent enzyme [Ectothiorhodospira lacustris]|uniref:thiamine pyrophosphate-dependent enzyme n=1 Tax=Ectothiorhodospira lacustris TaxID=2899127 RepID=UPI001EE9896A|nr:thiamine pyrophosphate-dependent enzyme [Ectothiorhodospira lacustris]MCG5501336.1 thiamine pyrophosphate-dependent enzyme [Ectothiorhodospira lacustris]
MSISVKTLSRTEPFVGHKACGGCGGSLVLRWVLKVLGERCYVVIPAGCMSAVSFVYPQMAIGVNAMIAPFAATAAVLSGIAAAVRAKGLEDVHVVGFAGDGATADIGLQALSGAFDRRERILYICYDNEAYMNTGIQKSGATPWGARTTTSPGGFRPSLSDPKKDLLRIAMAHGIPYAATGSVGYPSDLLKKIQRASQVDGPSFLHVFAPCPTGWGCGSDTAIQLGKGVVDTGLWPLLEWDGKALTISRTINRFAPLEDYLRLQRRFASVTPEEISAAETARDERWRELRRWVRATGATD